MSDSSYSFLHYCNKKIKLFHGQTITNELMVLGVAMTEYVMKADRSFFSYTDKAFAQNIGRNT